jgi:hypothetical protein
VRLAALIIATSQSLAAQTRLPISAAFDPELVVPHTDSFSIVVEGTARGSLTRQVSLDTVDERAAVVVRSVLRLGGEVTTVLVLDPATLHVRRVTAMGQRLGRAIDIRLRYARAGITTGTVSVPGRGGVRREFAIDTVLGQEVIDDNLVQTMLGVVDMEPGGVYAVTAFDASTNRIIQYTFTVTDGGMITVPAGTFETVRIHRVGGPVAAIIHLSRAFPRRLLRFELVGTTVVMELIR